MTPATVRFGLRVPPLPVEDGPERLVAFAERAERLGLDSLWIPDRLIPVGGYLAFAETAPLLEPLTALAYVAGRTQKILLGTGVVIAPLRHPLVLAKAAATVHHLSGERLILGLGTGWAPEEFGAVEVARAERGERTDEAIAILRAAFTGDTFDHHGRHFSFTSARVDPPARRPPPLWGSGGTGAAEYAGAVSSGSPPRVVRRLASLDGWLTRPAATPEQIAAEFADVRTEAERLDRDPDDIELGHVNFAYLADGPARAVRHEQQRAFTAVLGDRMTFERMRDVHWTGSLDEIGRRVEHLVDLGVRHVVLHPLRPDLDQIDLWVEGVLAPLGWGRDR